MEVKMKYETLESFRVKNRDSEYKVRVLAITDSRLFGLAKKAEIPVCRVQRYDKIRRRYVDIFTAQNLRKCGSELCCYLQGLNL